MTSFISTLSIFVLALASVCFTLPITEHPLFDTSSPFDNDVTTSKHFGERMTFDDDTMFSTVSHIDESMGFESSSMSKDATREPRVPVDMTTDESFTFMPTTEGSFRQAREMTDSSMVTVEPTTERDEFIPRDFGMGLHNETEVTTEFSHSKREFDDSVFTTVESVTERQSSERPFTTVESETSTLNMQMDFTTDDMSSFTSTSSAVAPELYTREPSATHKYTGYLADKDDHEEDKEHKDEDHKDEEHKDEEHKGDEHKDEEGKPKKVHLKPKVPEHKDEDHKDEEHKDEDHKAEEHKAEEHMDEEHKGEEEKPKKVHRKLKVPEHKHEDEVEKDEEHKKAGEKESSEEKKSSVEHGKEETEMEEHKQEGNKEVEEGREPEKHDEAVETKDPMKKRPTTYRKAQVESDDGIKYPKAFYDQDAWKNLPKIPSDVAVLDETSDVVITISKMDSLHTMDSHTMESHTVEIQLNQGEEPSLVG